MEKAQVAVGSNATGSLSISILPRVATESLQAAAPVFGVFYGLALVFAVGVMFFAPFTPVYAEGLERLQRSGAVGKSAKGLSRGLYVSAVMMNFGARVVVYALRWVILVVTLLVTVYVLVRLASNFFDAYLDTRSPRP